MIEAVLKNIRFVVFDFDGVFTDNKVIVSEDGKESVVCDRADGFGLKMLRDARIDALILSTETNPVVRFRAQKLKIECHHGCEDKLEFLKKLFAEKGVSLAETAFVGNDINDVACMRAVSLPVAVADAYPEALAVAKLVLKRNGGHGAVREFCEMLVRSRAL